MLIYVCLLTTLFPLVSQIAFASDFNQIANVGSTAPCSQDYSRTSNCYNKTNPPAPSIMRNIDSTSTNWIDYSDLWPFQREVDSKVNHFPRSNFVNQNIQALPFERSSNDGRITLTADRWANPALYIFRPEQLKPDLRSSAPAGANSRPITIHGLIYQNPMNTSFDYVGILNNGLKQPSAYHRNLCDPSGAKSQNMPRACSARKNANDPTLYRGDCYDITLMMGLSMPESEVQSPRVTMQWELRSSPVTLFVPDSKSPAANDIWIYPRMTQSELPFYDDYLFLDAKPSFVESAKMCYPRFKPNKPKWCTFLYNQKRSSKIFVDNNGNSIVEPGEMWDGSACKPGAVNSGQNCSNYALFEMSTTGDGNLMVLNANGIMYSYSQSSCDASGFNHFKPFSSMPIDPNIYSRYDIARSLRKGGGAYSPFRDTRGVPIPPGSKFHGAYGWIDRHGKNFFFAAANGERDGYRAAGSFPSNNPSMPASTTNPDIGGSGKAMSVVGAWTNGKIIYMDNQTNLSDFAGYEKWIQMQKPDGSLYPFLPIRFEYQMSLYNQAAPLTFRPAGTTSILSFENAFNEFNALSPTLPFDVVWKLGTTNHRNVELAFDEYTMPNAFIIAHMNSNLVQRGNYMFFNDGFVPDNPYEQTQLGGRPNFKFIETPKLQNAVTFNSFFKGTSFLPPQELEVLGGARVEPVGLGGMLGKGIYLDGLNDHILARFAAPKETNWFVSAWFDTRETLPETVRTLFYFPDSSWIGMSHKKIMAYNPWSAGGTTKEIDISNIGIQPNKYFHFALKAFTQGHARHLLFYINGTEVRSPSQVSLTSTLSFALDNSANVGFNMKLVNELARASNMAFALGDPGPQFQQGALHTPRLPFKGWVDELRVYSLNAAEIDRQNYFEEFTCNLALGSLVQIAANQSNNFEQAALIRIAQKHNLYSPTQSTAKVCEQLNLNNHRGIDDLADQNGMTICAGKVHQGPNSNPLCHRNKQLQIEGLVLKHNAPRPNFANTAFCLSCHTQNSTLKGLGIGALVSNPSLTRENDPRRQPLDWNPFVSGCLPTKGPYLNSMNISSADRCNTPGVKMDTLFDGKAKIGP